MASAFRRKTKRRLKILNADFVTSAAAGRSAAGIPRDPIPQIALAGRSNVGKSSLINALCRKQIARTSAAPGKTRLVNIYRVTLEGGAGPGRWEVYLVDLPGYGYARGGADSAAELQAVAEGYFTRERLRPARGATRPSASGGAPGARSLRDGVPERGWSPASTEKSGREDRDSRSSGATLLLVDSRHPGLAADRLAFEWLQQVGAAPHVVATKIDKLSRAERTRNLKALENVFGTAALPVSVTSGDGLDDVWKLIVRLGRGPDKTEEKR